MSVSQGTRLAAPAGAPGAKQGDRTLGWQDLMVRGTWQNLTRGDLRLGRPPSVFLSLPDPLPRQGCPQQAFGDMAPRAGGCGTRGHEVLHRPAPAGLRASPPDVAATSRRRPRSRRGRRSSGNFWPTAVVAAGGCTCPRATWSLSRCKGNGRQRLPALGRPLRRRRSRILHPRSVGRRQWDQDVPTPRAEPSVLRSHPDASGEDATPSPGPNAPAESRDGQQDTLKGLSAEGAPGSSWLTLKIQTPTAYLRLALR